MSAVVADALYDAADHIPVFLELQLPAKIYAPTVLDFDDYIVGTTAEQALTVQNAASAPASALQYSMTPPAGFGAPGGSFVLFAGTLVQFYGSRDWRWLLLPLAAFLAG